MENNQTSREKQDRAFSEKRRKSYVIKSIMMWTLVILVTVATIYTVVTKYIQTDNRPTVYLHDQFLDLDDDGDIDYLIYAEAVINCEGTGCSNYIPAATGSQGPSPALIPTPQVYPTKEAPPDPN